MSDDPQALGTVVVPAYNEGGTVGGSLLRIAAVLEAELSQLRWEILVVDDGSTDGTRPEAESAGVHLESRGIAVRVLRHTDNRGLGAALQTGFRASSGDVVVVVDCDLSYSPDHIPRLVSELVNRQAKIAIASPYMTGGSTVSIPRRVERRSRVANGFLSVAVRGEIATLTGMVRAYDGAFIRGLALKATDAEINIEAIYKTQIMQGRIVEIPAVLDWSGLAARAGRSRISSPRTRMKIYKTFIHGILFRPYVLFGVMGVALMLLGALVGGIAALMPGPQIEMAVVGMCAATTGLMLGFAGLLSVQIKRCFEELFFLGVQHRISGEPRPPLGSPPVTVPEQLTDVLRFPQVPSVEPDAGQAS